MTRSRSMSYQERRAIIGSFATTAVFCAFCYGTYIFFGSTLHTNLNDLSFWGKFNLCLFLSLIATKIVSSSVFAMVYPRITGETLPKVFDERDTVIELKSIWISHCVFIFSFLISLSSLAFSLQTWIFFVALSLSGYLAVVTNEIAQFFLYRTGE